MYKKKHSYRVLYLLQKKIKKTKIGICSILGPDPDPDQHQNEADSKHWMEA